MATQTLGLFKILSMSIKLFFKNGTSMVLIATLSLLSSSTITLLFTHSYHLLRSMFKPSRHTSSSPYKLILYFLLSLTFLILYALAAALATVLATAALYENNALPPCDLFSLFKSKWRGMFVNRPRRSKSPVRLLWFLWMAEITVAAPIAMFIPSPITIAVAGVLVVSFFIFVGGTAAAIAAVEDGCGLEAEGEEAGFSGVALNVSFNAALVAVALTFWWNVRLDLVVYGLFSANCVSLANVLWNVVYTVYYLRCGEYYDHGQMVVSTTLGCRLYKFLFNTSDSIANLMAALRYYRQDEMEVE